MELDTKTFEGFRSWHLQNMEKNANSVNSTLCVNSPEIIELHAKWVQELMAAGLITSDKDVNGIEKTQLTYHLMGKHLDNPHAIWFVDPESPEVIQARFYTRDNTIYNIYLTDTSVPGLYMSGGPNRDREVVAKIYEIGKKSFDWKFV